MLLRDFFVRYDMMGRPSGYQALVTKVIEGDLRNKEEIYQLCEGLWTGLNEWYSELGIDYVSKELPV
ncbi:kanamycin nucleotidyltransferase C-terminal domain-containing protein [Paenibacillus urinalis]|uniref:Kanamycin nucleotidyltransferase C-terminal domain-containing protein n=1 Tax=Paenibacillus urinalis TaxID=521520 RepID=A0AAX3N7W4_9BACL|nr:MULTISPECIES: kanamycin nucleotidyltransferase C-terminal domain-containing protein [Paenibacillus]WDH84802.1 kanamycin nucleotidyltransferase C-terminal domain-containing protein [Paenibacillus urinalis]WDH96261.1 kanamycin nucleotidyltransferase C-terminal domain-containing protein [Paenibacillus urinalis]WDI04484.1 kanamycin nucleotidyltransferase C-terminal domain-containing protein [Paenibacillus urinalis]GAK43238.1 hypothetical protein TCA2_5734 [Paenibacillus sp. TCA20]